MLRNRFHLGNLFVILGFTMSLILALPGASDALYAQMSTSPYGLVSFNKHKIITDAELTASGTMTLADIERALEGIGRSPAALSADGASDAQTIFDVSQVEEINPQVLLTLIRLDLVPSTEPRIGASDSFADPLQAAAQQLRTAFEAFAQVKGNRTARLPVEDGVVKPLNAATAALYTLVPRIGEANGRAGDRTGLYQFWQLWQIPSEQQPTDPLLGATCTPISPDGTLRTVSDVYTGAFKDFCFSALAEQAFEFSTCAPEGSSQNPSLLEIRSADGTRLLAIEGDSPGCNGRARLAWQARSAGAYRVRVRFAFGIGPFTMAYRTFVPPPCTGSIDPDQTIQTVSDSIAVGQFKDYCFDGIGGMPYEFSTCGPDGFADFDTVLELRDGTGRIVFAANDDFCDAQSYISARLPATQRYRIRIFGFGEDSGNFELAYRISPISSCTLITPGEDYSREKGFVGPGDFVDYCFDATAGTSYEFTTCLPGSADFANTLEIRNGVGDQQFSASWQLCGVQQRVTWVAFASQRFRLRVRGTGPRDGGDYNVAHRIVPPPPCIPLRPETRLQMTSGTLVPSGFKDYCIDPEPGQVFEFRTCPPGSSSVSTVIDLLNANASAFLTADARTGCSPGLGQQVFFKATAGNRFRVRVRNPTAASGTYTLTYQIYTPPACTRIEPEREDKTESATLQASSFKDYCFDAQAGQGFEFSTCPPRGSTTFSLTLEARDDSGIRILPLALRTLCGNGQEVVFRPAAAGTYRLRVLSGATGGNFTVAFRTSPWEVKAPIPVPNGLSQGTAVALDGILYSIGGGLGAGPDSQTNQVWAYDPTTNTWTRKADIPVNPGIRAFGSGAAFNGRVYVFGGYNGSQYLETTWIYNPADNTWREGARMPAPRFGSAVGVAGEKIIVAAGFSPSGATNTTWEYDPAADTYTVKAPMPLPEGRVHGVTVETETRLEVHVLGGSSSSMLHLAYNALTNTWITPSPAPIPFRVFDPAVVNVGGLIYVAGGYPSPEPARTQIYDPENNTWTQGPLMPASLSNTCGDTIDGVIYVVGGYDNSTSVPFTYAYAVPQ